MYKIILLILLLILLINLEGLKESFQNGTNINNGELQGPELETAFSEIRTIEIPLVASNGTQDGP